MTNRETIEQGLDALSIAHTPVHIDLLLRHLAEVELWNTKHNFVRASGVELAIKHTIDSLAGLPAIARIDPHTRILDIGSGAGFPGIPLAILLPDTRFTLVERMNKRAIFLQNVIYLIGLKNTTVTTADFRSIAGKFDVVTFRAFSSLPDAIDDIAPMLTPNGSIVAYKGKASKTAEEAKALSDRGFETKVVPLRVPLMDEERNLLIVHR